MINTISKINSAIKTDAEGFVKSVENEYHTQIKNVSETCISKNIKIIMLAGPSGSGKTTTAHILRDYIRDNGLFCEVVSLDDFYLNPDQMPKGENGKPDFETVYSLNIPEFNRCIKALQTDGESYMPIYDFKLGSKPNAKHLDIKNGGIVIIEGLHALNPVMIESIDKSSVLKMYISVNMPLLNDDGSVALTSRQMRLMRRINRDSLYRGADITRTLSLWTGVTEGERKHLYVFKDTADIQISTFHSFECSVLKENILKMLSTLPETAENYDYIIKAKSVLEKIETLNFELLPQDSLIREFVPGGKYE
ncbi:MAG: nucleoside kinase [Clostridia bacterium]|nr:nucleoside kinase [Clostridia bacterium]